jgi:N-methylhydantoinase A
VTDANLVLGRLDRDHFLGGEMKLDANAAKRVISELATRLSIDEMEAAEGVLTILNSNMANAIRSRTVQKGIDPRDFSLVAFGGAGPLHAAEVAAMLAITEVIVPPHPGITSAVGLLTTDLKYDAIRTEFQVSDALDLGRLNRDFTELRDSLARRFSEDGLTVAQVAFARSADLRYVGQGYELRVSMPDGTLDAATIGTAFEAFHALHEAEYGHAFRQSPIEIVNIRVAGVGGMPKIGHPTVPHGASLDAARLKATRCVFRVDGRLQPFDTAVYQRHLLPFDTAIAGPAVILQTDSTTVIPPGWTATAESAGNLILSRGATS